MKNRWNSIGSLGAFLLITTIALGACAPVRPGNPAYKWLNGKWVGYSETGSNVEANFQVVNGNKVTGDFVYTRRTGRVWHGRITSGTLNGNEVKLKVRYDFGLTPEYWLTRDEKGNLNGTIYHGNGVSGIFMKSKRK